MLPGLYSAASALDAATVNQELIAENLAQASTPGYRRQGLVFEVLTPDLVNGTAPADGMYGTRPGGSYTHFESGPIQQTGNRFDLALAGNAFFTLDGPNGPIYTRNGTFQIDDQGVLQNSAGLRVRGQGGSISIPPGAVNVVVSRDGTVFADGVETGKLRLATFANPQGLRRVGPTLFEGPPAAEPDPAAVRVEQGYREGSNVQVVQEMVSMMLGMRYYESAERAMRGLSDAVAQNTRPQS
jgi:flagellar basal body rod protein FlgG